MKITKLKKSLLKNAKIFLSSYHMKIKKSSDIVKKNYALSLYQIKAIKIVGSLKGSIG